MPDYTYHLKGMQQTKWFGGQLATMARPGLKIYLQGELGSGKTTLARGFINALGYLGTVKSPTYSLVEEYVSGKYTLYHIDMYRIVPSGLEHDWSELEEYIHSDAICLIEWPERALELLPTADINLLLEHSGSGGRRLIAHSVDATMDSMVDALLMRCGDADEEDV